MTHSPVAVITGASSGLGRATAIALAKRGARLVLVGRRDASLQEVASLCRTHHTEAAVAVADTADAEALERAAESAERGFGRIDYWINAAGVSSYGRFWELPPEEFARVIDVDVHGYANGARSALARMLPRDRGVIVNVASILGEVPQPFSSPYSMSKAAVIAFGRSLAAELALSGSHVRVVTVKPPALDTPIFQHSGNHTGRAVRALPPVYPVHAAVRTILSALHNPRRRERDVTVAGGMLVRRHQRHPRSVEAAIAAQTAAGQFERTTERPHSGNLFEPSPAPGSITGGWHGRRAQTRRTLVGLATAAGAVALVARAMRRSSSA
ncbi:SDR family NAD(P)-dependent oxidoreductase [Leifsonia sp. F6_8S_P_1B]|uniref:SDR family NAD(P)-dependent oxidoreductase n=1 Tax=Leifsonia williamsii TaxID=3035919 RepID=A0ABT8K944_9MICO|nr:SDR family NAD(P)-dependent oxidoreductase [Leifsonia williamsii]MDN4613970.1 SDR family NAD(P)-dependent oxidoreductase [Leifsonia williamsii]